MTVEMPRFELLGQTRAARYFTPCEVAQAQTEEERVFSEAENAYRTRISSLTSDVYKSFRMRIEDLNPEHLEKLYNLAQTPSDNECDDEILQLTPEIRFNYVMWEYSRNMAVEICIDKGIIHPSNFNPLDLNVLAHADRIYGQFVKTQAIEGESD